MKLFQLEDLRALAAVRRWPCISVCLPTHRTGQGTKENPIRLKNAVGKAREQLLEAGFPKDRTADLLAAAGNLVTSRDFWLHPADGLALFLAPEVFQYYRLPLTLQNDVFVADHFSIKQLIPLFAEDGRFYVLALSQKQIRFFDATRTGIQQRTIPDMLKNIDDLRQFDEAQDYLEGHTIDVSAGVRTNILFHGQGNIADKTTYKADLTQYLLVVSRRLEKYLGADTTPLVVAAVEYEHSLYRQVNTYHHLVEEGLYGSPDELGAEELHQAAWKIVEPLVAQARQASLQHFADLSDTDKTSDKIEEILPAAFHGRVRTLFLRRDARLWGRFDEGRLAVETHEAPRPGDTDLLDLAAIYVLQSKGAIYTLPQEEMPTESLQAALFRYAPG
jgi:hypothetical protein